MSSPDPRSGVQPDGSWVPAFEDQREPFKPGHDVRRATDGRPIEHGAYSPRTYGPLADEFLQLVLTQAAEPNAPTSYLLDVTYRPVLLEWAEAGARVHLLREAISERHDGTGVTKKGEELGVSRAYERAVARFAALSKQLGLDPLSRARLGRDIAAGQHDMAQAMAKATKTAGLRRREAEEGALDDRG